MTAHELLAAYAAGDVDADQRREVERFLAAHPEALGELAELEAMLAEVRACEPRPDSVPDWDAMARSIADACAADRPGRWRRAAGAPARLWSWSIARLANRTGRTAIAAGAGALAVAALLLVTLLRDSAQPQPAAPAPQIAGGGELAGLAPDPTERLAVELPTMEQSWDSEDLPYDDSSELALLELEPQPAANPMFDSELDGDPGSGEFVLPAEADDSLEQLTDDDLELLADSFEEGRPS